MVNPVPLQVKCSKVATNLHNMSSAQMGIYKKNELVGPHLFRHVTFEKAVVSCIQ